MLTLTTWQLIAAAVLIFLFGWGTGRSMGIAHAWEQMDRQEAVVPDAASTLFCPMEQTFGNVVYRTEGATVLAVQRYQEKDERMESYLMKTPNGRYFMQSHQAFRDGGGFDHLHPYSKEEAMRGYNGMPDKRVSFVEAFGEELLDG